MKECSFRLTDGEIAEVKAAMEQRGLTRSSDYFRVAVTQLLKRDKAAREKGVKSRPVAEVGAGH